MSYSVGDQINHPSGQGVCVSDVRDDGRSVYVQWPSGIVTRHTPEELDGWQTDEYATVKRKAQDDGWTWVDAEEPGR